MIPEALLIALISIESGGDCTKIGDHGKALGPLQIHREAWDDGCLILGTTDWKYEIDAFDLVKSKAVCNAYLTYWGEIYTQRTHKKPTNEIYARIWNGGPLGYKKKSTLVYWKKVQLKLVRKVLDEKRTLAR